MGNYERIEHVIRFLDEHHTEQPDLAALAESTRLSPFHLQRVFSAWAGVTPKDFLQCLTLAHAKQSLLNGGSVLDSAIDAGLSGPGRLHDLCVSLEAASPGELKSGGAGWTLTAGFAASPFGECLVAQGPRGICHVSFGESGAAGTAWSELREQWPNARILRDDAEARRLVGSIFAPRSNRRPELRLKAYVRGTDFQVKVWRALLRVPPGSLISYRGLANAAGSHGAARAVGTAVARNPIAYLIPCHRVIRETAVLGEYRWGRIRKRAMLAWERAGAEARR